MRLQIPDGQVARAAEIFAAFRDLREKVTSLSEALAGCLVAGMEEAVWEAQQSARRTTGTAGAPMLVWTGHGEQPLARGAAATAAAPGGVSSAAAAAASASAAAPPTAQTPAELAEARQRAAAALRRLAAAEKQLGVVEFGGDDSSTDEDGGGAGGVSSGGKREPSSSSAADDPYTRRTQLTRLSLARPAGSTAAGAGEAGYTAVTGAYH